MSTDGHERSRTRKALIALLVLLTLIVGGMAGFAWLINRTIDDNVSRELSLPTSGPVDDSGDPITLPTGTGVNILLIG